MGSTIEVLKETGLVQIGVTPRPLILCQLAAPDGDTCYLTTVPQLGGATRVYNGNTYLARLLSNVIDQIQAQSPQGYDIPGSVTLQIDDADFFIWTNHANAHGWRGGTLTLLFVLWDAPTNDYSTNAYVWTFILDKPKRPKGMQGIMTVAGQARQSMTRLSVPNFARQNMCGNTFPATLLQRIDGLRNPTSLYYGCGYSADVAGGCGNLQASTTLGGGGYAAGGTSITVGSITGTLPAAPFQFTIAANEFNCTAVSGSTWTVVGGQDGTTDVNASGGATISVPYTSDDYTRSCGPGRATPTQGCMARLGNYSGSLAADGDIEHDIAGNYTARFTGDTWVAPQGYSGRQYVNPSAGTVYGFNAPNPPTGATFYPQGYGTQWVDAMVLEPASDPNSYRAECIVCLAPIGPATIAMVLVNGVAVTPNNYDVLFTYRVLTPGGRSGAVNLDAIYNSQGDPHGGMCAIEIVVPAELQSAGSIASVQVLVQFPQCLHAMPIATAAPSGGDTLITFTAEVDNIDLSGGNVYIQGNSGIPPGTYPVVGSSGTTVTISGGAFTGTGGGAFYYPANAADTAMVDATGAIAANPVWALMDLLTWGPWTVADFDAQTWYDAAQVCAVQINYTDTNGNAATHARYRCSLVLSTATRQSLAKAVLGVRNCAGIILARNPANGLLQCYIEQTLADQQPLPIAGSNDVAAGLPVARPSMTAQGNAALGSNINSSATTIPLSYGMLLVLNQIIQIDTEQMQVTGAPGTSSPTVTRGYGGTTPANHSSGAEVFPCGYLAYLFDGGSAAVPASIESGTFDLGGRTLNDTPNTVSFDFQDSANQYVRDTITLVDESGYVTSGNQKITDTFQVLGIENFDQGGRRANVALAKALYGNTRFDAGGTELLSFRTTVKAAHLASRMGSICGINYEQLSF